jgi:hypothetical protein
MHAGDVVSRRGKCVLLLMTSLYLLVCESYLNLFVLPHGFVAFREFVSECQCPTACPGSSVRIYEYSLACVFIRRVEISESRGEKQKRANSVCSKACLCE